MKQSRLRFTTEEKLVILGEVHLLGLEPTLQKYHLTIEALIRWQKKFKGSKAGNFIHPIDRAIEKEKLLRSELQKRVISEKEDAKSLIAVFDLNSELIDLQHEKAPNAKIGAAKKVRYPVGDLVRTPFEVC